ncbi:methyltransferase domain-containing protein [Hahella ganghwensis]|uniref:methyltransferase domain-containing protein n=1 Tax=Hahella ganghwensis TaxID=286420 RepID=UPI0003737D86
MDYSIKFWDRMADRYSRQPISDIPAYEKKLSMTRKYFHSKMKVLEFGCGTGSTASLHAPLVSSYQAIDVSPKMVQIATDKLKENPAENLTFRTATLDDFQGIENEYDAILGLNILHLLERPEEAIQQVFNMLKPGGVFISNTACLKDTRPYLKLITPIGKLLRLIPYVKFLSRVELEEQMEKAGFTIAEKWVPDTSRDVFFLIALKPD